MSCLRERPYAGLVRDTTVAVSVSGGVLNEKTLAASDCFLILLTLLQTDSLISTRLLDLTQDSLISTKDDKSERSTYKRTNKTPMPRGETQSHAISTNLQWREVFSAVSRCEHAV